MLRRAGVVMRRLNFTFSGLPFFPCLCVKGCYLLVSPDGAGHLQASLDRARESMVGKTLRWGADGLAWSVFALTGPWHSSDA